MKYNNLIKIINCKNLIIDKLKLVIYLVIFNNKI